MTDLSVNLCGVTLRNPVLGASGTCAFGKELNRLYGLDKIGGVVLKTVTPLKRLGNPPVRVAEVASGMLNSVGLENPGVEEFMRAEAKDLSKLNTTVVGSIGGFSFGDYEIMAKAMREAPVDMVEMNISCPNVEAGGRVFGGDDESILQVTKRVKAILDNKPLMVKLSPNTGDIVSNALAAQQGGADCLSLINTLTGMAIDLDTRKPILHNVTGGLSGPAVRPVALRMVYQVCQAVQVPVIGLGGIMTGEDAIAFMLAGATAVQVGTATLVDPWAMPNIVQGMQAYCQKHGITSIASLIGAINN